MARRRLGDEHLAHHLGRHDSIGDLASGSVAGCAGGEAELGAAVARLSSRARFRCAGSSLATDLPFEHAPDQVSPRFSTRPDTDLELRFAATPPAGELAPYASRMSMRSVFFAATLRRSVTWKVTR
jgi:hypothetical protein